MASWHEIDRLRKDPQAFRRLAKRLLDLANEDFTEWETAFLESIALRTDVNEFTTRQSEKLLQIRDDTETVTTYQGFSIKALLDGCSQARSDLSEADEQWIGDMRARSDRSIKRRHVARLVRCARHLNLIEADIAA